MEGFVEWLGKGWIYFGVAMASITLVWNSFKLVKEIKENIGRPMKDLTTKVDKIDKELNEKIEKIDNRFENHIKDFEVERAKQLRSKILEFSDSILIGTKHSKETFDDVLSIIDEYEDYCAKNPDFKNHRCTLAVENIQNTYKEKLKTTGFIL